MSAAFTLQANYSLADINERSRNTLAEQLGIEFTEVGEQYLRARMPVDHRTHQPLGMLNGGASFALAETVGSMAANLWIDRTRFVALGLDMNGNHLRGVKNGYVYATARPFHQGKSTSVWEIKIEDDQGSLVCVCRLTMAIVEVKN